MQQTPAGHDATPTPNLVMSFDFSAVSAPFRMQPGLRRLAAGARQLSALTGTDRCLAAKLAVLSRDPGSALVQASGFDARLALQALVAQARQEYPEAIHCLPGDGVRADHLGWAVAADTVVGDGPPEIGACLRALPPAWRLAGLLSLAFTEDFAVIEADGRIPWVAVCLPSHWAPEDKVGRSFAEVHAPVADNQLLLTAASHLSRLVTGQERWERFVWNITPHSTLDQHPRRLPPRHWTDASLADAEQLASQAWLRTERQTFIPVAQSNQAVFTIRVDVEPLSEAVHTADDARRLQAALASMSAAVLSYRGLAPARDRLISWLQARADRQEPASPTDPA